MDKVDHMQPLGDRPNQATRDAIEVLDFPMQGFYLLIVFPTVRRGEHGNPAVRHVSVSPGIDARWVGRFGSCDHVCMVDSSLGGQRLPSPDLGHCPSHQKLR